MAIDADTLLDRVYLKSQIARWRNLAILGFVIAALALFADAINIKKGLSSYVARVEISGVISDDLKREDMLHKVLKDDNAKALIVRLDSPGGTAVGGEELYHRLKKIAEVKPVVTVMRDICTSACYMASLGTTRTYAREGTITGSIGVIIQTFEATKLAEKLGIKPVVIKSKPLKATPNPLEKVTETQKAAVQNMIDDFFQYFKTLVATERELDEATTKTVTDGRTFSGKQALELKLIDDIGGERDAIEWLKANHETISTGMEIRDVKPKKERNSLLEQLAQGSNALSDALSTENFVLTLDGLLSIWQPAQHIK